MQDIYAYTEQSLMQLIGGRIRRMRLEQNVSQRALARDAGVSLSSVCALEAGRGSALQTLIMVLRALGKLETLGELCEEEDRISPMEYMKILEGRKQRKRASRAKKEEEEWGW